MGVREIDRSLEQWQMGVKDLHSGSHTPGAGKVVRHPAAGPGLDGSGDGGGAGAGPPHYRTLGVGLRRGRACGPDIRADRWFPPPLTRRSRRS